MKLSLTKRVALGGRVHGLTLAGERLIVRRSEGPLVLDAASGETIAELPPAGMVTAVDGAGTRAAITEEGASVAGKYQWTISLWDLARGARLATLATNTPDDNVTPSAIGATRVLGMRKKKKDCSLCLYDLRGEPVAEHPLGDVDLPFAVAMSDDETLAAHAYFTGAGHLVDLRTGRSQKLVGGALRIGRQHEKGISSLTFDRPGAHVMYVAPDKVHVWSTASRKSLSGGWTSGSVGQAFFVAGKLGVVSAGAPSTLTLHALDGADAPIAVPLDAQKPLVASAGDDRHVASIAGGSLAVWNVTVGEAVAKTQSPLEACSALAASSDRLAIADRAGSVAIYRLA